MNRVAVYTTTNDRTRRDRTRRECYSLRVSSADNSLGSPIGLSRLLSLSKIVDTCESTLHSIPNQVQGSALVVQPSRFVQRSPPVVKYNEFNEYRAMISFCPTRVVGSSSGLAEMRARKAMSWGVPISKLSNPGVTVVLRNLSTFNDVDEDGANDKLGAKDGVPLGSFTASDGALVLMFISLGPCDGNILGANRLNVVGETVNGSMLREMVGCGVPATGGLVGIMAQPQLTVKVLMVGHEMASIKPRSPCCCSRAHVVGACPAISTSPSGIVTRRFCPPQMLQVGKPGLGGTGLANGAKVGKSVPGGGLGAADDVGFVDG